MSKSIQVANTATGEYDVRQPLPYPYHIDPDGTVLRQDFWRGEPARLAGFQQHADVQHVDLLAHVWLADDSEAPQGWFPVFIDADGGMWSHRFPVANR